MSKTKYLIPLIAALLVSSCVGTLSSHAFGQTSTCLPTTIESQVVSTDNNLNITQAVSLANSVVSTSLNTNFTNISYNWQVNNQTCSATWNSVNVYFATSFPNGTVGYTVVSENPNLSNVIGIIFQVGGTYGGTAEWSGYQFQSNPVGNGIASVQSDWNVPSTSYSSSGPYLCNNGLTLQCILLAWNGLSTGGGLTGTFGQAGSMATINCVDNKYQKYCSPATYNLWYEFQNSLFGTQNCGSTSPGDVIFDSVKYASGKISIFMEDDTNGVVCQESESSSQPEFGQMTLEIPVIDTYWHAVLPQFSSPMDFYYAYANGYKISSLPPGMAWTTYPMDLNNGKPNINLGSFSYSNNLQSYFAETWLTSAGT